MEPHVQMPAVYYIDTGKPPVNFPAERPSKCDKKEFFKGNWREAWPKEYQVHKEVNM